MLTNDKRTEMSDNDSVICPNCMHEFVAVPVSVQAKLAQLEEDYGRACKLIADIGALPSSGTAVMDCGGRSKR